ncbi:MAG: hypothetical protein ABJ277_10005, partial [Flavobacteriaceae bacterium]
MKRRFSNLSIFIFLVTLSSPAQKTVFYPSYVNKNFSADITKVELRSTETVIHFKMRGPVGGWLLIPKKTYIENAYGNGNRMYITRSEGITLAKRHTISNGDEIRYKLYFPPLEKGTKLINYGEANPGGNWFVYKLDISKNGKPDHLKILEKQVPHVSVIGYQGQNFIRENLEESTLTPKDLPKIFFGNWFDKFGTLLLITTPEYIVSNHRIQYYQSIKKMGDNKYLILTSGGIVEVLSVEGSQMIIRDNRIKTLHKKESSTAGIPEILKGDWLHWRKIKTIEVTENYIYNDDNGELN